MTGAATTHPADGPALPVTETRYGRTSSLGLHFQPGGTLFVERPSLFYLRLSGVASEVATQLARTGSIDATARIRSYGTGQPVAEVRAELLAALQAHPTTAMWVDGMLSPGLRITGSTEAYVPLTVSLQLTNACNLRCTFCYASSGRAYPNELDTATWLLVIQRLAAAGVSAITFTGGEPTIARGFPDLLTSASAMVDAVDIFTNGLNWRPELIDLVAACGNVQVQVSVDGLATNHDEIRGRVGSFDAAMETIERLSERGVPVAVAMTVTPRNVGDLEAVMARVEAAGALGFRGGRTVSVGRGDQPGFGLSTAEVELANEAFAGRRAAGSRMDFTGWSECDNVGDLLGQSGSPVEFLTPGYLSWHVRPDGGVTPCQVENRTFGNIVTEPLVHIGRPDRLRVMQETAQGCRCVRAITPPDGADLPFGLTAGCCAAPAETRCGGCPR